jgi:hypothetical protein
MVVRGGVRSHAQPFFEIFFELCAVTLTTQRQGLLAFLMSIGVLAFFVFTWN